MRTRLALTLSIALCWTSVVASAAPVTVHNPWLVNDRVADTHNINTMAATYVNAYTPTGVVPPSSNQDKAINIYNNQKRRLYHWADEPPNVGGNDITDPTYTQNVFGWSLCGRHARQGCTIANAVGFGQRVVSVPGDNQMEFYYDGGYHLFHTMMTFYVFTGTNWTGHIASAAEIKANNNLVLNAAAENRACPGYLLCGDTASWEASACNSWSDGGSGVSTTRWTGNMDLRTGQIFQRTWYAWQNECPTPKTDADSGNIPGPDAPYHHESQYDYKDTVNFPYWEPYGQVIPYIHTSKTTYRRWSNGTDVLTPDFRSANCQALLDSTSHDLATYYQDGVSPDLHPAAVGTTAEAVFKVSLPFYITDANFSGDFVKTNSGDVCSVLVSSNGTSWTTAWSASALGTTHVANQSLRSNVFGLWQNYWIKIQLKSTTAKGDAGVSNFVLTTIFEHNKGATAYLDKGVNNITLTFDNPSEVASTLNCVHVTYKWKEYSGTGWTIDKQYDGYFTTSPATFSITTGGTKVPRTEYIQMEVIPQGGRPFLPVSDLAAPATSVKRDRVQLNWTAVDDGLSGTASQYDLRYSTSPISDMASFGAATPVAGVPAPKGVGGAETFTVSGLSPATTYYFGIVVYNALGNNSGLSNVVQARTRKLGDIDGDGQVNLADLKLLVVAWNSQGGGTYGNWNPDADFDGDNYVNLSDLKILVAHWNQ